jgi:actin-like ATPase involved in cell morphogenesis
MKAPVLGIDFGTTQSSAVVVQTDDQLVRIKDPVSGGWSIPSAICANGDGTFNAGTAALNVRKLRSESVLVNFKRDFAEAPTRHIPIGSRRMLPEQLTAELFSFLRQQAEALIPPPWAAVEVCVPAAWEARQRKRLQDAVVSAGFAPSVVHLTEEPVAAAHFALIETPGRRGDLVLIYDFGGGTFDAALVEIGEYGQLNVRGYDGEPDCGGMDIDGDIIAEAKRQAGEALRSQLSPSDRSDDSKMLALMTRLELPRLAAKWKHHLSVDTLIEDELIGVRLSLSREQLEQMAEPFVAKTIAACERLLEKNHKVPDEITRIMTVGGSSRMPIVNRMLSAHFRRPVIAATDPELAIAHGAALLATSRARGAVLDAEPGQPASRPPSTINLPELAAHLPAAGENGQPGSRGAYIHAPFLLAGILWGQGNPHDAERWYVLAAEAGHRRAAYQLGWMYQERGDHDAAAMWWEKAARGGDGEAAYYLGELLWYLNAPERAEPWFLQSAQGGHPHAAYQLGWLHRYRGDLKGASYFWGKAAQAGDVDAAAQLELLRKKEGQDDRQPARADRAKRVAAEKARRRR